MPGPDFLIIGAMKCGTSTLHAQLSAQTDIFMCSPKEPNFFSDNEKYSNGLEWYESLFDAAPPGSVKGEASTHYTKLPTYPDCVDRLHRALPDVRLIYMVRNPIDRLVSHYIHEWTMGVMRGSIGDAIERHQELVDYSRYAMQIEPYVERYGVDRILVLPLEDMKAEPQRALERVGAFLGLPERPVWDSGLAEMNVSAERLRRFPFYAFIVEHPVAAALRRTLVPRRMRDMVKARLRMRDRPSIDPAALEALNAVFDRDRARLEEMFPYLRAA
jgi:hypothetical protein